MLIFVLIKLNNFVESVKFKVLLYLMVFLELPLMWLYRLKLSLHFCLMLREMILGMSGWGRNFRTFRKFSRKERRQCLCFQVHHIYQFLPSNLLEWNYLVPKPSEVIISCHDLPLVDHFCFYKTLNRVKELYYWPRCQSEKMRNTAHMALIGKEKIVKWLCS